MSVTSFSAELLKRSTLVLGQQDFGPAPSILAVSIGCDVREELFESLSRYELAGWMRAAIGSGYSRNVQFHSGETDIIWGQRGYALCASLSKLRWERQKRKQFVVAPPVQFALRQEGQRLLESVIAGDNVPDDERMRSTRLVVFAIFVPMQGSRSSPFLERFLDAARERFSSFDLRDITGELRAVKNAPGWAAHGFWGMTRGA